MNTKEKSSLFKEKQNDLWKSAQDGHLSQVQDWIENKHKPIDSKDDDERTALHWAASSGHDAVVKYLLDNGATPDTIDDANWTPVMSAASSGHCGVVHLLLQTKKIDVNRKNDTGRTVLHYACSKNNPDMVEILLQAGARVKEKDNYGFTPLHRACGVAATNDKAIKSINQIVDLLIARGADIHTTNNRKETPLHIAVQENNEALSFKLVNLGADVLQENEDGKNALELAPEALQGDLLALARKLHPKN